MLHFISLNSCFDSKHVIVRLLNNYQDFIADSDYEIFIQIPGLIKRQSLKNAFLTLHVLRNRWFTTGFKRTRKHLQLSTDNQKSNACI